MWLLVKIGPCGTDKCWKGDRAAEVPQHLGQIWDYCMCWYADVKVSDNHILSYFILLYSFHSWVDFKRSTERKDFPSWIRLSILTTKKWWVPAKHYIGDKDKNFRPDIRIKMARTAIGCLLLSWSCCQPNCMKTWAPASQMYESLSYLSQRKNL